MKNQKARRLRYAIIGTGAIGGYYGARLQQSGCDVHFLLRSDYEHVRENGLVVESIDGDFMLPEVNVYSHSANMPPVDVAIVALKTTQNFRLPELLPSINPGGAVLLFQNGIGVEAETVQILGALAPTVSAPTVLGGLCFICVNKVEPGHIKHLEYGRVLIGAHDGQGQPCAPTPLIEEIIADLTRAKIEAEAVEDLPMARWKKLVWNVPYNGLSVVLNATTDEMMADEGVRSLITTLMQEVITVANAWAEHISPNLDRSISDSWADIMLAQTESMQPYRTSMKIDYDKKRPLEIDAILGNPLRIAQKLDLAAPSMTMLYHQLCFLNAANAGLQ